MNQDIARKITDILVNKIGLSKSEVTDDASFTKDLSIDSVDMAEIVMEFERTFDLKIPDSDYSKLSTLSRASDYIESRISPKAS